MTALAKKQEAPPLDQETDLSTPVHEVVHRVQTTGGGVMLKVAGEGVAVVLSISAFEELQAAAAQATLQRAVDEAEEEVAAGHFIEHDVMKEKLRRWAAGDD